MSDDVQNDPITYKIGDDRALSWGLLEVDGDKLAAGGGWRAHAQVRPYPGGPVLHQFDTEIVERADGWRVKLLVAGSRSWTWQRGVYDVYVTDPSGRAQPIAEGTWVNLPAVTEWTDG